MTDKKFNYTARLAYICPCCDCEIGDAKPDYCPTCEVRMTYPDCPEVTVEEIDIATVKKAIKEFKKSDKWDEVDLDEKCGFPIGFECGVDWAIHRLYGGEKE